MNDNRQSKPLSSMPEESVVPVTDWSNWVFECPQCPGKRVHYDLLDQHQRWHGRVNLLFNLRSTIRSSNSPQVMEGVTSGFFFKVDYEENKHLLSTTVTPEDIQAYLKQRTNEPFITLSYGRKYTFGSKFISRHAQGDFVYLDINGSGGKMENYFNLECNDQGIWITLESTSSSNLVSVNGLSLNEIPRSPAGGHVGTIGSHRKLLEFGDVVTVSTGQVGESMISLCDLIYQAGAPIIKPCPSLSSDLIDESSSMCHNILHFLPTEDAQGVRLFSDGWITDEASKILPLNRVILTLCDIRREICPDAFMCISDYIHSPLYQLAFPRWKLGLPIDRPWDQYDAREVQRRTMMDMKMLDDLKYLFKGRKQTVRSLHLTTRLESETRIELLEVLLSRTKSNLETLALCFNCFHNSFPPPPPDMRILQSLYLSLDKFPMSNCRTFLHPFLRWLLPAATNIQSLTLTNSSLPREFVHISSPELATLCLDEIASIQRSRPEKFTNLTKITLLRAQNLKSLSVLRFGTLKSLELGELRRGWVDLTSLGNHGNTLDELTLHYNFKSLRLGRFGIIFPHVMSNLKSLSVYTCLNPQWADKASDQGPVLFRFGGRRGPCPDPESRKTQLDYSHHLPSLSSLTVWPVDNREWSGKDGVHKSVERTRWNTFLPIVQSFLQVEIGTQSVEFLDIPLLLKGKYTGRNVSFS